MNAEIIQIHPNMPVVSRFRVQHLAEALDQLKRPHAVFEPHQVPSHPAERREFLRGARLLVLHRLGYSANLERLIEEAHRLGIRVLFECDDLIFFPDLDPNWVHGVTYLSEPQQQEYFIGLHSYARLLALCDGAIVSTNFLAACVHAVGKPAFVIRNALDRVSLERSAQPGGRGNQSGPMTIVYSSGSRTHDRDFQEFSSALQSVLELDRTASLHLLGPLELDPSWDPYLGRIARTAFLPYDDYFQLLGKATLCLAPLESENPFCRAKSELKFIEAGAWGVPVLATRTGAYAEAIDHGVDGFLARSVLEQTEILEAIVADRTLASAVGARAEAKVRREYTTAARAADVQAILSQMMS